MFLGEVQCGTDSCTSFASGGSRRDSCRLLPRCPSRKETSQHWYHSLSRSSEFHWLFRLAMREEEVMSPTSVQTIHVSTLIGGVFGVPTL